MSFPLVGAVARRVLMVSRELVSDSAVWPIDPVGTVHAVRGCGCDDQKHQIVCYTVAGPILTEIEPPLGLSEGWAKDHGMQRATWHVLVLQHGDQVAEQADVERALAAVELRA
jgi:hypothetical protein